MQLKAEMRARMTAVRDAMPAETRAARSLAISRHLAEWSVFQAARVIFAFSSMRSEVDTRPAIELAQSLGKTVALPRTLPYAHRLEFRLAELDRLQPGAYGILEPSAEAPVVLPDAADLILTPGLAFDRRGYRLGYGGGYYDRLLRHTHAAIAGLAFAEQVIEAVPHRTGDRRVQWLITDAGIIACEAAATTNSKG